MANHRTYITLGLVMAAAGAGLATAAPAAAGGIGDVLSPAFGTNCSNLHTGARSHGETSRGTGSLGHPCRAAHHRSPQPLRWSRPQSQLSSRPHRHQHGQRARQRRGRREAVARPPERSGAGRSGPPSGAGRAVIPSIRCLPSSGPQWPLPPAWGKHGTALAFPSPSVPVPPSPQADPPATAGPHRA